MVRDCDWAGVDWHCTLWLDGGLLLGILPGLGDGDLLLASNYCWLGLHHILLQSRHCHSRLWLGGQGHSDWDCRPQWEEYPEEDADHQHPPAPAHYSIHLEVFGGAGHSRTLG